jgi:hypothetical protein
MTQASRGRTAEAMRLPCAASASKRFGRYKDEQEKAGRGVQVDRDEKLSRLIQAWKKFDNEGRTHLNDYRSIKKLIRGMEFDPSDIYRFCTVLGDLQKEREVDQKTGLFLSAIINKGRKKKGEIFVLPLSSLHLPPVHLGLWNRKDIVVHGNGGSYLGEFMTRGGSILVKGDAGDTVGRGMCFGEIRITGNCGEYLGTSMRGGKIIVEGNAGEGVGHYMAAGVIEVWGSVKSIGYMRERKILVGHKLIEDR